MLSLPRQALSALIISFITAQTKGQTTCAPLMQALVQQAEATNGYGSWDACCARTGIDCYLTQVVVAPGFEPCDVAHSARAGCNRLAQGTVCMIGGDGLISGSPCGSSIIRSCGSLIARGDGVAIPFDPSSDLQATFASILSRGVLGSQLCCSTSACTFTSPCTSQYNMSACVTDGVNSICIPLDQPDNTTYAAQIVQDGNNCIVTSSTYSSSTTSTTSTAGGVVPTPAIINKDGGGNATLIGEIVGGAVAFVCIAVLPIIVLCVWKRRRGSRTRNVPSNEPPGHRRTTPSFPSHPGPQWRGAIGTLPSFPDASHQNQNIPQFPAFPQNPSPVHQDPHADIITRSFHRGQIILEPPADTLQVYQDQGAGTIRRPPFQPPGSPPPPSFRTVDFTSPVMDTQAMEARIAALENRVVELSGPSSEGSRRGGAAEAEADPPQYDDLE